MKLFRRMILILTAVVVLIPFVYTILNAFMSDGELFYFYGGLMGGEEESWRFICCQTIGHWKAFLQFCFLRRNIS